MNEFINGYKSKENTLIDGEGVNVTHNLSYVLDDLKIADTRQLVQALSSDKSGLYYSKGWQIKKGYKTDAQTEYCMYSDSWH